MIDLFRWLSENEGFTPAPLDLLVPDNEPVRFVLLQHRGDLQADERGIGNTDTDSASTKILALIEHVVKLKPAPSLLATPEYSVPWTVIDRILSDGLIPEVGKIWILGCESITPDDLRNRIAQHADVIWYSELDTLDIGQKTFLDPIIMIFREEPDDEQSRTCISLQFKTKPMGGAEGQLERDHLIRGRTQYYIKNIGQESVRLVPLICADSLDFIHSDELDDSLFVPHLMLHLQCTPDVFRAVLKEYRDHIYQTNEGVRYGCITLNWARGTSLNGDSSAWHFGGSGLYERPPWGNDTQPRQNDEIVDSNHNKGVYLKFCDELRFIAYYLSPTEELFDIQTSKIYQELSTAGIDRAGVQGVEVLSWDETSLSWQPISHVKDGVDESIQTAGIDTLSLLDNTPTNRERLLAFSTGNVDYRKYWHRPRHMQSYQVAPASEIPGGTLVRLRNEQAVDIDRTLQQFATLEMTILNDYDMYPNEFGDLAKRGSTQLGMNLDVDGQYSSNLEVNGESANGAMIFLGDSSEPRAKEVYDKIVGELSPNRVTVWFREAGNINQLTTPSRRFSEPYSDPRSINRRSAS